MVSSTKSHLEPWKRMKTVDFVCSCGEHVQGDYPEIAIVDRCDKCVYELQQKRSLERLQQNLRDSAEHCGIPAKFRDWSPIMANDIGSDKLLDWLRALGVSSAWIGGTNGIGKTHTVLYRAYELLRDEAVYSYCVRASSWLRETVTARTKDNDNARYRRAVDTKLLILDDLGKERLTEPRGELLYDIIDERDRRDAPIWITTNFTGQDLMDRMNVAGEGSHEYGYAIMKRLKRMITVERIWK